MLLLFNLKFGIIINKYNYFFLKVKISISITWQVVSDTGIELPETEHAKLMKALPVSGKPKLLLKPSFEQLDLVSLGGKL